ncbi:DNA polymerase I [Vagococcus fluvialis]|uniref:DNA polymerase I n=1 Tax=Vagococcus fluvialis TaxID=2738 RepID=A0A369AY92_9ENTE|nr:DNA polymerase I [Vagococcus fluvialis]MBO0444358.1 DNA polymerase I [Vagococcus fluvialis]MBO0478585.1 DNA polymerase I [Vagococcus fluvialis]MBO0485403.1 DNA polymerase I [Vagococcus fluvialis]MBO0487915.1 DNA polymerase I [Vagococcus fluvialis]MDT2745470.1 DNA polymerase I [Vagococcus fluvialis]
MTKNKLLLIDGNSIAFRGFFALYQSLDRFKNSSGLHTNALYAVHNMLENVLEKEQPTHVLVAFDAGKTTFRHSFYDDYKSGRAKTPSEFKEQMPYLRDLIEGLGMKHYELENYEADDIIGTLATHVDPEKFDVVVLSGDKDLTQLASDNIRVDVTVKGVSEIESYTPEHILEKYGLEPHQIIDMKGLAGDQSDNIPGVTKIGEKTAIKLLKEFGTVEGVYENVEDMKKSKMKENLINEKEIAFMSKRLATIDTNSPIEVKVEDLDFNGKNLEVLIPFYKEMDFNSFLGKLDSSFVEPEVEKKTAIDYIVATDLTEDMFSTDMSLYVEMLDENYHLSDVVGIAFGKEDRFYVTNDLAILDNEVFSNWISNEELSKKVFDTKRTEVALNRYDLKLKGVKYDMLLGAYLLDSTNNSEDMAEIAQSFDYFDIDNDEAVYGKGAKKGLPEDESVFFEHLARKIRTIEFLYEPILEELENKNQLNLYFDIELPLAHILGEMEIEGITLNASTLQEMKGQFAERLEEIEQKVYAEAGEEFNLNSPKQLGVILFEKMKLPVIKKTKTGYSTAVDVLEKLKGESPIIDDILSYRQIAKIQSTYVEGLLKMVFSDNKIHTRYVQTLTQTGRLSSVDPNLQNIPIRLEEGRKIRQAFVPRRKDWQLFSSDYSQIELRVLADISQDEHLRQAFIEEQDIHTSTAMRVFGVESADQVDGNLRRQAKAVNFGIVYGISDYGLSQNLGITRKEAQTFIDTYFEKYPGVKKYMEDIVREAKDKGYVETLYHRRRYLPDINSRNFNIRSFAERTAINTPIQGSAADILKIAMIKIDKKLKEEGMEATMLLQVHDELVFEAPKSEIPKLQKLVEETMADAVSLSVPLKADSSFGDTWYEAK